MFIALTLRWPLLLSFVAGLDANDRFGGRLTNENVDRVGQRLCEERVIRPNNGGRHTGTGGQVNGFFSCENKNARNIRQNTNWTRKRVSSRTSIRHSFGTAHFAGTNVRVSGRVLRTSLDNSTSFFKQITEIYGPIDGCCRTLVAFCAKTVFAFRCSPEFDKLIFSKWKTNVKSRLLIYIYIYTYGTSF